MKRIRPAFKCHGGKYYLSKWIIDNFPDNYKEYTYLEPFCGGANVFINKEKSKNEIINDIDASVINIFKALRDEPKEFIRKLRYKKYCENTFNLALLNSKQPFDDYLEFAVNELILRRMSRGGLKKAFAWSDRTRGGKPGDVNAWKTCLALLPELAERLEGVFIFNKPAIEIIQKFNKKDTLVYCDPPYVHETRTSKNVYGYEMTNEDHTQLANVLNNFDGKVIVSGYPSTLYNKLFKEWNCVKQKVANHSSQSKTKKIMTEYLWKNF